MKIKMNKKEIKSRINMIKSKEDFNDIKIILCEYLSIYSRVNKVNYESSVGFASIGNDGSYSYSSIGGNKKNIIQTLNRIVDDYSMLIEIVENIKCNLKTIFNKLFELLKNNS